MSGDVTDRVTVIVVGYNSEKWLDRCLTTLSEASASRLQLCFVDNLNNPGLESIDLTGFELEVLQTESPLGFVDANNFGLQQTRFDSEYTVFLNQDTVSTAGWIDACVSCFKEDAALGIISPELRTYDLQDQEPNLAACLTESGKELSADTSGVVTLRHVTAAAMVIRTDVLRAVGPFDPLFGSYYEDYDLCRRVRHAGYSVAVCAGARVGHFSGSVTSSPDAIARRSRKLIRNRLIHAIREQPDHRLRVLAWHCCCALPRNLIRGLLRTESSQSLSATLGAHWDLLQIAGRLVSRKRDETCWQRFLSAFSAQPTTGQLP